MENNQKKPADLINRYVFDVVRRLKPAQRNDIEKELRTLIDDMLADRTGGNEASLNDVEAVLIELGRPFVLAAKYREEDQYLIGPQSFEIYTLVLKIVLAATAFGMSLALIIGYIVTPPNSALETIGKFFSSVFGSLVQAFAWVTIIFALVERFASKDTFKKEWAWKPGDLPPVPHEKATIKKGEPIVGIIFSVIFLVIVNAAPWLFGVWFANGNAVSIPIFDLAVWNSMLPLIDALICLGILKEVLRLIFGRYTLRLAAAVTIINVISLITFIYVFAPPAIWNGSFLASLQAASGWNWAGSTQAADLWAALPKVIIGLTVFGHIVDTIVTIVRSLRYRTSNN
ncbi:MAG: hypothetical protein ACYCX2_06695 [Christensenellales bacterium]